MNVNFLEPITAGTITARAEVAPLRQAAGRRRGQRHRRAGRGAGHRHRDARAAQAPKPRAARDRAGSFVMTASTPMRRQARQRGRVVDGPDADHVAPPLPARPPARACTGPARGAARSGRSSGASQARRSGSDRGTLEQQRGAHLAARAAIQIQTAHGLNDETSTRGPTPSRRTTRRDRVDQRRGPARVDLVHLQLDVDQQVGPAGLERLVQRRDGRRRRPAARRAASGGTAPRSARGGRPGARRSSS